MTGYLHWKDFLDDDLIALTRNTTLSNRQRFIDTTVTTGVPDYRRSKVLWHYDYPNLYDRFTARLRSFLPYIQQAFPQLSNEVTFELQMTSTGNDQFFKRHTDNGCEQTCLRVVTFVYYYTLEDEQRFSGGQLLLETAKGQFSIEPVHNTIVMFPAGCYHEIMPVIVPSLRWEDNRTTLNGWILKSS